MQNTNIVLITISSQDKTSPRFSYFLFEKIIRMGDNTLINNSSSSDESYNNK